MGVKALKAEFQERKVRELLRAGYSVSKIAKLMAISYNHEKVLSDRLKGEEGR